MAVALAKVFYKRARNLLGVAVYEREVVAMTKIEVGLIKENIAE